MGEGAGCDSLFRKLDEAITKARSPQARRQMKKRVFVETCLTDHNPHIQVFLCGLFTREVIVRLQSEPYLFELADHQCLSLLLYLSHDSILDLDN